MTTTGLSLDALAPVRVPRRRPARALPDVPKPSSRQLTIAIATIAATGWADTLAQELPGERRARAQRRTGGRRRTITIDAVLVAMLLLPLMERPFIVRDVARLLDTGLDANTRRRLGLAKNQRVTERMVSRLWNQIAAVMGASPYADSNAHLFDTDAIRHATGLDDSVVLDDYDIATYADHHLSAQRARLAQFIRAGLAATFPHDVTHTGDYALDASYITS